MAQEKNLPATTRRLNEARKRGQAAKSTEVNTAVILLIALVGLRFFGEFIFQTLGDTVRYYLTNIGEPEVSLANIRAISFPAARTLLVTAFPVVVLAAVAGVIANVMQSGLMLSMHPLKPDLGRINPISGAKRLLSAKALVDLVRNIVKLSLLITVFWLSVSVRFDEIALLGVVDPISGWQLIPEIGFDAALRGAAVLGLIGLIDLLWQRYQFRKDLRMSNQEVKQEHKDTEGDPLLRRRIRERGRALAEQRMMAEIPGADVIITNPVHLAIALRYDTLSMNAPTVVAKGQRLIAQRIRGIATEHNIPIVENRPLAQTIFRTVDIGQEIPDNLYKAVAEVLAFVFGLKRKAASVGR
jgi:flagellar biosynthesis protein FlhB